jgi:spore coat protein CotF
MSVSFTQKERALLQDQKGHEQICVDKYNAYSNQAQNPQLKRMFKTFAGQEQQHLNTINQMLAGQAPNMGQQGQQAQQPGMQAAQPGAAAGMNSQNDAAICTDMLMTEKYVSGAYDTAIFEFKDANVRQALNHIQKEEQQHGEGIFNFMQGNGMYNTQQ